MKTIKIQSLATLSLFTINSLNCNSAETVKNPRPNILLIVADDLGYADLGCCGSDFYETPTIDSLRNYGMRFTQFYSCPNSAPARATLMSGMYSTRHGVYTVDPPDRGEAKYRRLIASPNKSELDSNFHTLAEELKDEGYHCASIGKWHLGDDCNGKKTGPLGQGFDYNIGGDKSGNPNSHFYPFTGRGNKKMIGIENGTKGEYLTDRIGNEAIKYLHSRKDSNQPFFLYLPFYAVHAPWQAPQNLIKKYKNKEKGKLHSNTVYAAMIESVDTNIKNILAELRKNKQLENTIIVFLGDNGGVVDVTNNYPLRGGKGNATEGGDRVPMIIYWKNIIKPNTTCNKAVNIVDLYPTFVEIAGGNMKDVKKKNHVKNTDFDGLNIVPLFYGKEIKKRAIFSHFPAYLEGNGTEFRAKPYSSIRKGDWKLIHSWETGKDELYNIKLDIQETSNLADKKKKKSKRLKKELTKWLKDTHASIPTEINAKYQGK